MNSDATFEVIVNEHYEALFRFALSLTRAESDAQDLTQQVFYVWATKGHQLRDPSKVRCWLFTTLHRAFLAVRRKHTRFPHHDLDDVSEQLPAPSPSLADHLDSPQVLSALSKVDETFQPAVALFYLENYSYKDIAATLEVPVGTVKSRIARGVAQLREILLEGEARTFPGAQDPVPSGRTVARPALQPAGKLRSRGGGSRLPPETAEPCEEWDLSPALVTEPHGDLCVPDRSLPHSLARDIHEE